MYHPGPPQPVANHFSLDVECVAIGTDHNARAVAQIAVVDEFERVLLNVLVKPDKPVVSYLTPLTGLTAEALQTNGVALPHALQLLRSVLPRHAVLVGQNIGKDVGWLGLREGEDFAGMVDLTGLYRVYNDKYKTYSVFSQDHLCRVLLRWDLSGAHDAALDALKSIRLWRLHTQRFTHNADEWASAQAALLATAPAPSFAKQNPTFEGVCMGNRRTCACGAPFFG